MIFDEAKNRTITFGKHRGMTLDEIAETDDGLRYLDWLRTARCEERERTSGPKSDLECALEAYLSEPTIQRELEIALGDED